MHIACSAVAHAHAEKTPVALVAELHKKIHTFYFFPNLILILLFLRLISGLKTGLQRIQDFEKNCLTVFLPGFYKKAKF